MSFKLKPLTTTSWLVLAESDNIKVGILTKINNEYTLLAQGTKQIFSNENDVNVFFNEDIFDNLADVSHPIQDKTPNFIKGYPVDFDSPHEVISVNSDLPLFSKHTKSDVYFSAGYYCLKFPKNLVCSFCPKLSTLETHEYAGPYKTELEAKSMVAKFRKERNNK